MLYEVLNYKLQNNKNMSNVKLDWTEAQEIADVLLKLENPDEDYATTENALAEKWNIDLDTFQEIANGIFQMIDFGMSPLTQTAYVGISKDKREWIAKKECDQQFISAIINWATEGEEIPKDSKGFVRTITKGKEPEFDITISKSRLSDSGLKSEAVK